MINTAKSLVAFNDRQKNAKVQTTYSEETETFYNTEEHSSNPDAHHPRNHASSHALGGDDYLSPELIGAGKVFRLAFDNLHIIDVNHNLGVYPMVQVIQENEAAGYGTGLYGGNNFGGTASRIVAVPLNITHNSRYNCTVELSIPASGEVICIG